MTFIDARYRFTLYCKRVHDRYLGTHERLYDVFALHTLSVTALRILANSGAMIEQLDVALAQSHSFNPQTRSSNPEKFLQTSVRHARAQVEAGFYLTRQNSLVALCSGFEYLVKAATGYALLKSESGANESKWASIDTADDFEKLDGLVKKALHGIEWVILGHFRVLGACK